MKNWLLAILLAWALPALALDTLTPAPPAGPAAREAPPTAADPEIEQRLVKLATDLRCLVCQNESLAGSHSELAEDLRREIRDQMRQGKDDNEVIAYLTERYGDFVLYRPPFKPVTWLLWLGPLLFLGIGLAIWYVVLRRRRAAAPDTVDASALAAAARILEEKSDK